MKSGACDSLLRGRRTRVAACAALAARGSSPSIDGACEHGSRTQRDKDLGQADLFGGGDDGGAGRRVAAAGRAGRGPRSSSSTTRRSRSVCTGAATRSIATRPTSRRYGAKTTADLLPKREAAETAARRRPRRRRRPPPATRAAGARPAAPPSKVAEDVSIGGIVAGLRPLKTRKGDRMCVFMLDDPHGSLEVVVFPEAFKQFGHLAENGQMVLVKGKFERDDESARILASEISPIELVSERLATSVAIRAVDAAARPRDVRAAVGRVRPAQGRPPRGLRHRAAAARTSGCACASTSTRRSASGRRNGWCRRSRRSAAPARS